MLNTHVHDSDIHKGSQSVLFVPTVVHVYLYEGALEHTFSSNPA